MNLICLKQNIYVYNKMLNAIILYEQLIGIKIKNIIKNLLHMYNYLNYD